MLFYLRKNHILNSNNITLYTDSGASDNDVFIPISNKQFNCNGKFKDIFIKIDKKTERIDKMIKNSYIINISNKLSQERNIEFINFCHDSYISSINVEKVINHTFLLNNKPKSEQDFLEFYKLRSTPEYGHFLFSEYLTKLETHFNAYFDDDNIDVTKIVGLLSGIPGTGKTSLIRYLATKYNCIIISIPSINKVRNISDLYFIINSGFYYYNKSSSYHLNEKDLKRKIIVFEDFLDSSGSLTNLFKKDKYKKDESKKESKNDINIISKIIKENDNENNDKENIEESDILQLFDGLVQLQNIVFFTTNEPEQISEKFRRRMTIDIHMDVCTIENTKKIIRSYFNKDGSKKEKRNNDGDYPINDDELIKQHLHPKYLNNDCMKSDSINDLIELWKNEKIKNI